MPGCNPNDMLLFAKAAELGGISAAARATGRPKATISRAIARLENALNARLLARASHRITLTDSGQALLDHCQRIAEEVEDAQTRVGEIQGSVAGLLRVVVPVTFGRAQLGPLLPKLLTQHPLLRLEVRVSDRMVDPIKEGFDVAVLMGPLADSSLAARELGRASYGLYASPGYLAARAPVARPMDLAAHPLLTSSQPPLASCWSFERDGIKEDVVFPFTARLESNDASMRRDAAVAGLGIALVPSSICKEAVEAGLLLRVLPEWAVKRSVPIYAVWPGRRHMSPRLRAFLDFLDAEIPFEHGVVDPHDGNLLHRS
ncbi:MAG: LysR family transcriptional regulator [Burkholderiaceae bacterium]